MVSTALQRGAAARRPQRLITWGFWLLLPAVTYIFLLIGFPLLLSIYYSFSHISVGRRDFSFAGLANSVLCLAIKSSSRRSGTPS